MKSKLTFTTMLVFFFLLGISCENDTNKMKSDFKVEGFSHTGCKNKTRSNSKEDAEYMHLKTVAQNTLRVQHLNATFNCCPQELIVNTTVRNDTILINEDEKMQGCNCVCKYDLRYKLVSLDYGTYHVMLKRQKDLVIEEFDLDFNSKTDKSILIKLKDY